MKSFTSFILLSVTFAFTTAQAQSVLPGYWQVKESFKINGIPLPSHEDKDCITKKEAKDVKASIVESLQKQGCSLTHWNIKGQDLKAGLKCKNNNFNARGTLQGTFTKKAYTLHGIAKGKIKNTIPAKAAVEMQGNWISTCPKSAGAVKITELVEN